MADWTGVAGRRVVITGATNGIGLAGAKALAARGAQLTIVARSQARAAGAAAQITAAGAGARVDTLIADLASQASIRRLAAEIQDRYPRLDVLVNNAGAINSSRQLTEDGIEMTWAVNHLAPFLLTTLLLERLRQSAPARVITTASDAHKGAHIPFDDLNAERSYRNFGFARYGETKLANILFTAELARRLAGTGVTANCFHPGFVATGFNRNNGPLMNVAMTIARPFARSVEKGAETLVWLVDSPQVASESGGYFVDKKRATPTDTAQDVEAARRLWEISEKQTQAVGVPS
ncbi:MAG: SDR family NAD(P)-dependent oxidoreductase [Chloroflexi bacterium]|nr:MAG: SDR family NAD(P)-dependent oxidoreductase [Chloroflexota bacterium]